MNSILLSLFLLLTVIRADDPCNIQAGKLYTTQEILACYNQLPYSKDNALKHVDIMKSSLNFHVFRRWLLDPPAGSNMNPLDVISELDEIAAGLPEDNSPEAVGAYRRFHGDVSALMMRQRDPHSVYIPPKCLQITASVMPLRFTIEKLDGKYRMVATSLPESANWVTTSYDQAKGTQIAKLLGMSAQKRAIRRINGKDPFKYAQQCALEQGYISKDDNAMFDNFVQSLFHNKTRLYDIETTKCSCSNHVVIELESGDTVELEQMQQALKDVTSLGELTARCGTRDRTIDANTDPLIAAQQRFVEHMTELSPLPRATQPVEANGIEPLGDDASLEERVALAQQVAARALSQINEHKSTRFAARSGPWDFRAEDVIHLPLVPSIPEVSFSAITNAERSIAYLRLASFSPDEPIDFATNIMEFTQAIAKAFKDGKPFDKVVIDVQNNGGGYVDLGYLTANILGSIGTEEQDIKDNEFAQNRLYPLSGAYDYVATEGSENFAWSTIQQYLTELYGYKCFDKKNLRTKTIAGEEQLFSGVVTIGVDPASERPDYQKLMLRAATLLYAVKKNDDVIVVTNGLCGSTCATFINRVAGAPGEPHLAKIITTGGVPGSKKPMLPSSFPGGAVIDTESLYILTHRQWGRLPSTAYLRFPHMALYPFSQTLDVSQIPIEFMNYTYQADGHIDFYPDRLVQTSYERDLLEALQPYYDVCFEWSRDQSGTCHVSYAQSAGKLCTDGQKGLYQGRCKIINCGYPYMPTEDGAGCIFSRYLHAGRRPLPSSIVVSVTVSICLALLLPVPFIVLEVIRRKQEKGTPLLSADTN